jgi:hypothetical protein
LIDYLFQNLLHKKSKYYLFFCIFILFNFNGFAQTEITVCGTPTPPKSWATEFQNLITDFLIKNTLNGETQLTSYTIPVIFHIIHGGQAVGTFPNILQGQINSQITVLNQDYRANGLNIGTYPVNAFIHWVINQNLPQANRDSLGRVKMADINIMFCLAEKDTLGNTLPEPGIERINFLSRGWQNPNTFTTPAALRSYFDGTIKPQSIWNVTKYLNIWVSDKNSAIPYTGFSTYPPLSGLPGIPGGGTAATDGIWCFSSALGSSTVFPGGIYASQNVKGRTITHEAGHYLGLLHIWGDGNCLTDYCNDTPPAFTQNVGLPAYPLNPGSCSSPSNSPDGEMFMNFMDYTADPGKYMFTVDQAVRMQTAMVNSPFRNQLGTHGLCTAPIGINYGGNEVIPEEYILYQNYPNPFNPETKIQFYIPGKSYVKLTVYDISGKVTDVLVNQLLEAGRYKVTWRSDKISSGIYFYELKSGKYNKTMKMVFLK